MEEDRIIIKKYSDCLTIDLLEYLPHRTVKGITSHAYVLGLKKSDLFYASWMGGRISNHNNIGEKTRFARNMPGWNKGKKQSDYMSPEKIEKTKATRFQKGQDPHNTVPIGTERISKDGYIEVKIQHLKGSDANNNNFEFKHRIIYEKHFGPIPKGMIVEFMDRDKLNFDPSNLVLRSRKENLLQNTMCDASIVKRFLGVHEPELVKQIIKDMPAIIELKRNAIKLNQKIKKQHEQS